MFDAHHGWNVSFKPLFWGLILSALLLGGMYWVADASVASGWVFALIVLGLAIVQAIVQFILFMHVGIEQKPRWGLMVFLFMLLIIFILVAGSLWIMANINYNAG